MEYAGMCAKRYAFFRKPDGTPYRGTDGKHDPKHLLAHLADEAKVNASGGIEWPSFFGPSRFQTILGSALVIIDPDGEELNEADTAAIAREALFSALKKRPGQKPVPPDVIDEADQLAAAFYRKPQGEYAVLTSLSVKNLPSPRIAVHNCVISSLKARPPRFPLPRVVDTATVLRPAYREHLRNSTYRMIKVACQGRSIHEAIDRAFRALNLLRALWSLFATYDTWKWSFGSMIRDRRLGVIHIGPIHTLHQPDGKPIDDAYWYDPTFSEESPLFKPKNSWEDLEKLRRNAMRQLSTLPHRSDVESLLVRYAAALDRTDLSLAFLMMWGILEKITNTVGARYDETIDRAVWVFEDRLLAKDILNALRSERNQFVHSGRSSPESEQIAYFIKSFVDPHLLRLLGNPFKVSSLPEYAEFLALPTDVDALEAKRRAYARALRTLRKKP